MKKSKKTFQIELGTLSLHDLLFYSHFLNKHDFLDQWIEEAFEEMEDEIINKQWDNFYVKPNEADIEEVDSDTETEPDSKTKTSNLSSMISELYCPKENLEHVQKKRKISKSVRDRGLEAIKDVVETLPRDLPGELKYRHVFRCFGLL